MYDPTLTKPAVRLNSLDRIKRAYPMKELHPKSAFEHLLQVHTVVNIKKWAEIVLTILARSAEEFFIR
jgi:hypothetical protein